MILVINAGSTSLKYKLLYFGSLEEKLGAKFEIDGRKIKDHAQALRLALREIGEITKIKAVGHRVVHGANDFFETTLIDKRTLIKLEAISYLAPLHNPANLSGIKACQDYLPQIKQWAVFDTAFFHNLPEKTRLYPLDLKLTKKYSLYRFGFHGLSHQYAAIEASRLLAKPLKKINLIICHLGGGCSVSAIKQGQPIDTSMGFTPMEGLMMLTRTGDIDPGIIFHLLRQGLTGNEVEAIFNRQAGIKGIGQAKSYLELLKNLNRDKVAKLAFEMFIYRLKKYIGAYLAILNKIDALVFTGQIGSGNPKTRQAIARDFKLIKGIKRLTIKTNEEYIIAKEVKKNFK